MKSPSPYAAPTIWLFLTLLVFYVALTRGHFWSTDEIAVFQQTRSLWEHGDLAIAPINNTVPGRGGKTYAPYGAGQSILALPLYGLGVAARYTLPKSLNEVLAGPVIGDTRDLRWGGEVEIFFVNLFNCAAIAGLVAVFFAFQLRMGVEPGRALMASLLLGVTTHVAGFSTGFFQHGAEALFVLWTFYFLFRDSRNPSVRSRALAGAAAGLAILVRISTLAILPVLAAYLLWNAWKRNPRGALREWAAFLIPAALGMALQAAVNYAKFGAFSLQGSYARLVPFDTPLGESLYGFLFSPGESVFVFSPLLILSPWYFRSFARRYRNETIVILAMSFTYLLFYSKAYLWHGQWSFGPRYLVAIVPLLLLPLGAWLAEPGRGRWIAVGIAAALGLAVEILAVAINVSYVYYFEKYADFGPRYGYIFSWKASQIVTHFRALRAWDGRVDFWLWNVKRMFGVSHLILIAVPLCVVFAICVWKLSRHLRAARNAWTEGIAPSFVESRASEVMRATGLAWLTFAAWILLSR
jgi:hypothetical protein